MGKERQLRLKGSDLARKQFVSGHCRGGVNVLGERPGAGGGVAEHKTGAPQQRLMGFSPFCNKSVSGGKKILIVHWVKGMC